MEPQFSQDPDDPAWWTDDAFVVDPSREPIALTIITEGEAPDEEQVEAILAVLGRIDELILASSELLLDNYSYDYFRSLGVADERLLKDETLAGMSQAATLTSAVFEDCDGSSFELSFVVPWDEEHTFDVAFEEGEPVTCAVNG